MITGLSFQFGIVAFFESPHRRHRSRPWPMASAVEFPMAHQPRAAALDAASGVARLAGQAVAAEGGNKRFDGHEGQPEQFRNGRRS